MTLFIWEKYILQSEPPSTYLLEGLERRERNIEKTFRF